MAHFTFISPSETSATISMGQLKTLVDGMPSTFGLSELMTFADRSPTIGYKFLPDEAIRTSMEIAKARQDQDFGYAQVEAYLDEVERLEQLIELVESFDAVKEHLEDHLAKLRAPAARETLAEYASLQARARARGDAKLRQQVERLADLIPPAGDHPAPRAKTAKPSQTPVAPVAVPKPAE